MRRRSAILVAVAGLLLATPSQAAVTHQIPGTVVADCSIDVSQPIRSWIASIPDNSTLSFGSGACYRIDGTLGLRNRSGLDLNGNGATFLAGTVGGPWRAHWRLTGGTGLKLRNMTIRGGHPAGGTHVYDKQWQHAIDLLGVTDVEVANVAASDVYGDCFTVSRNESDGAWSSGVHIRDSSCSRNGRQGVAVVAGHDIVLERNTLSEIALNAFDIEPDGVGFGARNVVVRDNTASGALNRSFFAAIGSGPVDSVTVSGNRLNGAGMYMAVVAPPGQRRSNITITRNSSDTGYHAANSAAQHFVRVDGLTVAHNTIPLTGPSMALASVSESCNVNIWGNGFPGGVVEARISPYPCTSTSSSTTDALRGRTSTTLRVRRVRRVRAGSGRTSHARRAAGRVRGAQSGRVVIRLERFDRPRRSWVKVRSRKVRVRRDSRFAIRLRGLERGRWRARARFRATRNRAPSESPYRYFLVG